MSGCRSNSDGRADGFTLIELLVVISIIALMVSILLPALSKARELGKQTVEMCAARQTMTAMHVYSHDYNGQIIPGYFNTASFYSGYEIAIPDGTTVTGEPLKRWPWRLSYYLEHQLVGSLMVNEMARWGEGYNAGGGWGYEVSLWPSLGMNVYWVGGWEAHWGAQRHLVRFDDAAAPSELIVLSSARNNTSAGVDYKHGYFWVGPKHRPGNPGWAPWAYQEAQQSLNFGHVHPRYNGHAVTARIDGHVELDSLDDLRDMRLWSDQAYLADDPDYLW